MDDASVMRLLLHFCWSSLTTLSVAGRLMPKAVDNLQQTTLQDCLNEANSAAEADVRWVGISQTTEILPLRPHRWLCTSPVSLSLPEQTRAEGCSHSISGAPPRSRVLIESYHRGFCHSACARRFNEFIQPRDTKS